MDLLLIETVSALNEAEQAILAAKATAPELPVLVMVTVDEDANCLDGSTPETAATRLTAWGADAIAAIAAWGRQPCSPPSSAWRAPAVCR